MLVNIYCEGAMSHLCSVVLVLVLECKDDIRIELSSILCQVFARTGCGKVLFHQSSFAQVWHIVCFLSDNHLLAIYVDERSNVIQSKGHFFHRLRTTGSEDSNRFSFDSAPGCSI